MQIGLIGLGKMGANMTERLLDDGHRVTVFDLDEEAVRRAGEAGARVGLGGAREGVRGGGLSFLDAGVSGGVWGLEVGYRMMIGGPEEAFRRRSPPSRHWHRRTAMPAWAEAVPDIS